MPSSSQKTSMSLGELAICEDFLDSQREYAIGLFSNVEKIRQWHETGCPEAREGLSCSVCELCSADGLLGVTREALVSLDDVKKRLQEVRASLGKSVPSRVAPSRETLFKSNLATTVLLRIVTVGDTLRTQHAMWQTRLQNELATSPSSDQSLQDINTGPSDLDRDRSGDILFPTYSGPKLVSPETNPKLAAAPTGWVLEPASSSSRLVVFRRCLSSDCPCETNRTNAASNTRMGGACGSQVASKVPPPPSHSKKTRTFKVTAKLEAAIRGSDNHAARSMTTTLERCSKGTSGSSDALAKTRTNTLTRKASTYHDPNSSDTRVLDAQRPQDVALVKEHAPSDLISETALLTQETESSLSSPELIVDPRVFRLRAQIVRSDDTCRALVEWCRAWMADLQLNFQERHGTGPEASLMHESTMKDTRGYPPALARGHETVEPRTSLCTTGQVGEAAINGLPHGDDETTAQEQLFNSEQEELKRRWLEARRRCGKDRTRHPALV